MSRQQPLDLELDTAQLRKLYQQLKAVGPEMPRQLRKEFVVATQPAVGAVKSSADWSSRIPDAVKTRVSFGKDARIEIYVDSKKAPEAAPLENQGRTGTFRHPVFADAEEPREAWTWVNQTAHPFIQAPVYARLPQVETGLLDAAMTVLRKAGFV